MSSQNSVDFWLRLAAQANVAQAEQFEQFAEDARRELEREAS